LKTHLSAIVDAVLGRLVDLRAPSPAQATFFVGVKSLTGGATGALCEAYGSNSRTGWVLLETFGPVGLGEEQFGLVVPSLNWRLRILATPSGTAMVTFASDSAELPPTGALVEIAPPHLVAAEPIWPASWPEVYRHLGPMATASPA
jgi:hypothetical protein